MALPALLPALGAIGSSFVGSVVGAAGSRKERIAAENQTRKLRKEDRAWFETDRKNDRKYYKQITDQDREYASKKLKNEREYARGVLVDDRRYSQAQTKDQRSWENKKTAENRRYLDQKRAEDINQQFKDREFLQKRSNSLAEKNAASRGIDFVKMRDDAVKAGYNPMTALSMAHAYSTERNYSLQSQGYSPGANYTALSPTNPAGGGGGSGGGAAPGAVMGSVAPAGGSFSTSGGGYQADYSPALAAGSFIKEGLDRAIDQWTNKPDVGDPLADALRNAFQQDQMAEQVRDAQVPKGFGYDLTKAKAFQPAATFGVPALASAKAAPAPAKMPSGMVQKGGKSFVPVSLPDGSQSNLEASVARRYDIKPFDTLSAGDWEEIRGGVVGEVENTVNADQNYDTMTGSNFWPVPPSASDYSKSGRTGQHMFSSWPSN